LTKPHKTIQKQLLVSGPKLQSGFPEEKEQDNNSRFTGNFTIVISVAKNKMIPNEHHGLEVGNPVSYSRR
jgi:hypothetical protein